MIPKSLIRKIGLVVVLLVGIGASQSAGFKEGMNAYNRENFVTALKKWKPLAEQGNRDAQFFLGMMYAEGLGVPKDYKLAVSLFRQRAE